MDERKIEAPPQRVSASADHPHPDSRTVSINGAELRIDHGHVSDSIGSPPAANISATLSLPPAGFGAAGFGGGFPAVPFASRASAARCASREAYAASS